MRGLLLIALLALSSFADARDASARREFVRENPKPAGCDRCEVDHKQALMNGGADHKSNMQWLSHDTHKEKTRNDYRERKGKK